MSVYFYIFSFLIFFSGILFLFNVDKNEIVFQGILQILSSLALLVTTYLTIKFQFKESFTEVMGIDFKNIKSYIITGILATIVLVLFTTIINILSIFVFNNSFKNPYESFSPEKIRLISIFAILIAPIVEEVFFRGFIQPVFVKRFGMYIGIFTTSVIFGLSHSQYTNYSTALLSVIAIGIVLGIVKEKTGSIIPGILAHFINNFLAALVL
ncbi:MAG: type II CAAX endopeptidase family protein [Candidatus Gastranaerophilaceae bacterium]